MKYENVCLGFLSFVNDKNKDRRINLFKNSLSKLSGVKKKF